MLRNGYRPALLQSPAATEQATGVVALWSELKGCGFMKPIDHPLAAQMAALFTKNARKAVADHLAAGRPVYSAQKGVVSKRLP